MANSRKSHSLTKLCKVETAFERALEEFQARVSISASGNQNSFAVAYSGGLDSSVLLHLAARHAKAKGFSFHAFHVHHGFSPNADDWLSHCEAEAARHGALFTSRKVNVDIASINADGLEQAARQARYEALRDSCIAHGIRLLLTAHHQDDQAETLMLQLMRGAGLPGLSGMAAFQENHALLGKEIFLGRPLLDVSRAELERYGRRHSMCFVSDESNRDAAYRRNALRNLVFPMLEEHFPGFASCVVRSASHIRSAQNVLQDLTAADLAKCRDKSNYMALGLNELSRLSPQRRDNVLRQWLKESGMRMPSTARLEQVHSQLFNSESDRHPFFKFDQFVLSRVGQRVILRPNLGGPQKEELLLQWHGEPEIAVPPWRGTLVFESVECNGIARHALQENALVLRPREGQERLKTAPNRPSKTLKNLFQEAAIPVWQREWLPVICMRTDIVAVAGLGMDVRHCTTGSGIRLVWRPDWQNTV